ncbi:MAG: 30S ribosome-binding factor RbfA [bacterium]
MATKRILQVNELIKRELGQLLWEKIDLPEALITVTRVETTENLRLAKIYISVLPEVQKKKTYRILHKLAAGFQWEINKRLRMRPVPRLRFMEEKEAAEAERVEELLTEIEKGDIAKSSKINKL